MDKPPSSSASIGPGTRAWSTSQYSSVTAPTSSHRHVQEEPLSLLTRVTSDEGPDLARTRSAQERARLGEPGPSPLSATYAAADAANMANKQIVVGVDGSPGGRMVVPR